jgi:hypothetical protein
VRAEDPGDEREAELRVRSFVAGDPQQGLLHARISRQACRLERFERRRGFTDTGLDERRLHDRAQIERLEAAADRQRRRPELLVRVAACQGKTDPRVLGLVR